MNKLNLFRIGAKGVNVVTAPTHLSDDEVTSAQNAETESASGEYAIDQRPGMTKVNSVALNSGASVLAIHDVLPPFLSNYTAYLYAGMYTGAAHNWRRTSDGTTWANVDTPALPSNSTTPAFFKTPSSKVVTVNGKMYFVDSAAAIGVHQWDGTNDITLSTIPPAVSGANLLAPNVYPTVATGLQAQVIGTTGAVTYSYKFVSIQGAAHSAVSGTASATNGVNPLSATSYINIHSISDAPPAGATSLDVYRTAGGATQGKIGTIAIVAGAYTNGNGSGFAGTFSDAGLVGDGTTAPATVSGATSGDAVAVLDMITDGTLLYLAVLDVSAAVPFGRILSFNPQSSQWAQIGSSFAIAANGNGTAGTLISFDGALSYGTYLGTTAGTTSYLTSTNSPLPAGGIAEVHTTAASQATCAMAMFNGDVYAGYVSIVAGTAAIVAKRVAVATWSTARTGPATALYNAYTSLCVFNGYLFAGWTSGGGATAARIESTPDGINWTLEYTAATTEVVGQMVVFNSALYVVLARTSAAYNTTSRILKRDTSGTWTEVDNPSDDFSGALGIVYI